MISFGSSSSKTTTNSKSQTDPWDVTIPYLTDFLGELGGAGGRGISPDQALAFAALKANAAEGNPWTSSIAGLADQAFGTKDRTGTVQSAFEGLKGTLGDIAGGKYLDVMQNPELRKMIDSVGTDTQNRINAMFAGAGRDLSGANQESVAKGVTAAQLPIIMDQYNRERAAQADAAKTLHDAEKGVATTSSELDAARLALQRLGIDLGDAAIGARDYAANQILNLDQQIKQLPLQDLGLLASILFPVAGMGAQEEGTSKGKSSSSGFGISISDRRVKRDVTRIGTMAGGVPIYRWRYLWSDRFHVGPMAQDIAKHFPFASVTLPGGLLAIDFDALAKGA